jgi:hypothetical protein
VRRFVLVVVVPTSLVTELLAFKRKSYVGQAVLVLESGHAEYWSIGVLEYCGNWELQPVSAGLELLSGAHLVQMQTQG